MYISIKSTKTNELTMDSSYNSKPSELEAYLIHAGYTAVPISLTINVSSKSQSAYVESPMDLVIKSYVENHSNYIQENINKDSSL